jgi:phosphoglycolate phosphatase
MTQNNSTIATLLPPPTAILFDWDNTLVDTLPVIHAAVNAAFAAIDKPAWTLEETRIGIHRSGRDARAHLYGDKWHIAEPVFYKVFKEQHLAQLTPMEAETAATLQKLQHYSLFLGVVSNKRGDTLRTEAAHLGWTNYFQRILGATDATHDKPDPAPVHKILENTGLTPSKSIWFVGDSISDMHCAHNAGLTPVLYKTHPTAEEIVKPYSPHFSIEKLPELTKILDQMGLHTKDAL